jgi:hypothetical protein
MAITIPPTLLECFRTLASPAPSSADSIIPVLGRGAQLAVALASDCLMHFPEAEVGDSYPELDAEKTFPVGSPSDFWRISLTSAPLTVFFSLPPLLPS